MRVKGHFTKIFPLENKCYLSIFAGVVSSRSFSSQSRPPPPQATYQVTVKTGQAADAGTTARAHVTLQGSKGTLKRRRLLKNGRGEEFAFLPGKSAVLRVRGRDVGDLTHVTSEFD